MSPRHQVGIENADGGPRSRPGVVSTHPQITDVVADTTLIFLQFPPNYRNKLALPPFFGVGEAMRLYR